MHGASGNVLFYRDLSERLGSDIPFYGLQSQGIDGNVPPLESVEEMARKYVQEIRGHQPEGPYQIGGYCLGGTSGVSQELMQKAMTRAARDGAGIAKATRAFAIAHVDSL